MNNALTRRDFVEKGAKGLVASLVAGSSIGCAARAFPKGHMSGLDFGTRNQDQDRYKLERIVIYGRQFYAQKTDETSPETLPFGFYPFEDVKRIIDLDSGKITLDSDLFVPQRVEREEGRDEFADEIVLRTTTSNVTGIRGIRADILTKNQLRRRTRATKQSSWFVGETTEQDALYGMGTVQILGEQYFFPHVSDNRINDEGKLLFYLIPVRGAKLKVENDGGRITIINENNIFRPMLTTARPTPAPIQEVGETQPGIRPGLREARYIGRDLFKNPACPDCSYYRDTGARWGWIKEYPDGNKEFLNHHQIREVRKGIRRLKN